ncbi:MAG: response regulator transcription factor [Anaerolineales bacterium]|nr:response regulator transcription factor [Anaerolineales bacterium]
MDRISVLIVDDHSVVRCGLKMFLDSEDDIQVVGEAAGGQQAIDMAQELLPDVILMDLVMPGIDGIDATRRICELIPSSQVLVLTSFGEDEKVFASIKAGAMGYLLKDIPAEDLGRAIRSMARGEFLLDPGIARKVLDEFSSRQEKIPLAHLTPREIQVLTLVARGRSNREISDGLNISIKTVKTHVSNILSKLHAMDRTQAALYAVKHGLIPAEGIWEPDTE